MGDIDVTIDAINAKANASFKQTDAELKKVAATANKANANIRGASAGVTTVGAAQVKTLPVSKMFNTTMNQSALAAGLSTVGFSRLGASLSALPLLLNPVTLMLAGGAGLAFALYKVADASGAFRDKEMLAHLAEIETAAKNAATGWDAYYDSIIGGASAAIATQKMQLATAQAVFGDLEKETAKEVKALELKNKQLEVLLATSKTMLEEGVFSDQAGSIREGTQAVTAEQQMESLRQTIEKTSREIERNTVKIDQHRKALIPDAKAIAELTKQIREAAEAEREGAEDARKAIKEANDERERYLRIMAAIAAIEEKRRAAAAVKQKGSNLPGDVVLPGQDGAPEMDGEMAAIIAFREEVDALAFAWSNLRIMQGDASLAMESSLLALAQTADQQIGVMAAGAFDAYADALDETVSLNALASASLDRTMRNIAASTIRSIGQKAMIEGAFESAKALAALARYDLGAAALHGKAAVAMFALAGVAGVAAGAMSVAPGSGGSRAVAGADPSGGASSHREARSNVHVTVIGALDKESRAELARQLKEEIDGGDL